MDFESGKSKSGKSKEDKFKGSENSEAGEGASTTSSAMSETSACAKRELVLRGNASSTVSALPLRAERRSG
jgi:hypothetical protein